MFCPFCLHSTSAAAQQWRLCPEACPLQHLQVGDKWSTVWPSFALLDWLPRAVCHPHPLPLHVSAPLLTWHSHSWLSDRDLWAPNITSMLCLATCSGWTCNLMTQKGHRYYTNSSPSLHSSIMLKLLALQRKANQGMDCSLISAD